MSVNHRIIHASAEQIFEVLADAWSYPSWVVGASRARAVSPDWPAVGAELHHSFGIWPLVINDTTSIEEWDPPRRLVLRARGGMLGSAHVSLEVQTHRRECVIRMTEHAASGPSTLIPSFIVNIVGHTRNREALRRLAYQVEKPHRAPDTSE
ncbi:SRPBCC family protein [Microbacterium sp. STN6]|uniref:SRPBCC family protein n=1 Tax=Microbacterium sp. STN6 TaxID=2995588 RepID=UPI002260ECB3|nr:SRPBCC family protein [Microbacterium sp. STN6]MCX7521453.1 SRPBCC family protein [Microbacterium sp. STN6]